jgi:hypothetical protein
MVVSSTMGNLGQVVFVALDRIAGVHYDLAILNFDGEYVQRAWRRTANHFAHGVENRTVTRTVKPLLVLAPRYGTSQMGTSLPEC